MNPFDLVGEEYKYVAFLPWRNMMLAFNNKPFICLGNNGEYYFAAEGGAEKTFAVLGEEIYNHMIEEYGQEWWLNVYTKDGQKKKAKLFKNNSN